MSRVPPKFCICFCSCCFKNGLEHFSAKHWCVKTVRCAGGWFAKMAALTCRVLEFRSAPPNSSIEGYNVIMTLTLSVFSLAADVRQSAIAGRKISDTPVTCRILNPTFWHDEICRIRPSFGGFARWFGQFSHMCLVR